MKFIHFADLHLNNIQTGKMKGVIPIRVLDVLNNLRKIVDFAIKEKVDYIFFSGDAYKTYRPQNMYRTMFYDEIVRLAKHAKVVMIAGNHDMTRRDGAKHALSEFKHLNVSNVYILDDLEFVEFDECVVLGIPWQFQPIKIPNPPQTDKPIITLVHGTVKGSFPITDTVETVLGGEFVIDLQDLHFSDYVALGHIHKFQVFEKPLAIYPSSLEAGTWGEVGKHGFVYGRFNKGLKWEYIELETRPRIDIVTTPDTFTIPEIINPEAMYRITVHYKEYTPVNERINVEQYFQPCFDFTLRHKYPPKKRRMCKVDIDQDKNTILANYLGDDFEDVEELWYEIRGEVEK